MVFLEMTVTAKQITKLSFLTEPEGSFYVHENTPLDPRLGKYFSLHSQTPSSLR
jgi:hypothetical protein